ncbi:hypothetical protein GWK47_032028 [Chionoecetes opilio]|uniref:Uncharacterized protein n=1 Tax=Chionoecetes opilio TaxID=41210 RepID=A0A8J5D4K8_CHIOP|nr:hypothetical protein GWK47_032028 [Chionoecetes opilio]
MGRRKGQRRSNTRTSSGARGVTRIRAPTLMTPRRPAGNPTGGEGTPVTGSRNRNCRSHVPGIGSIQVNTGAPRNRATKGCAASPADQAGTTTGGGRWSCRSFLTQHLGREGEGDSGAVREKRPTGGNKATRTRPSGRRRGPGSVRRKLVALQETENFSRAQKGTQDDREGARGVLEGADIQGRPIQKTVAEAFPAPSPLTPEEGHVRQRGRRALWRNRRPRRGSPKGAVGQSRARKTAFRTTPGGPTSVRPCARNPAGGPGREAQKRELPLEERLVDSSGPRAKGPEDPRAPEPGRPTPTGTTRILGDIHTGVSTPGMPLPKRRSPTNTAGPPPGTPPAETVGASRHQNSGRPPKSLAPKEPSGHVTALGQWQGGQAGGGRRRNASQAVRQAEPDKPDREDGRREKSDPGEEESHLRQLTEEGNRKSQQGGVFAAPESPGEKNSPSPVAPATEVLGQKNGTPEGKSAITRGKPPEAGRPGSGAQDGEDPGFTLVVPRSHTVGRVHAGLHPWQPVFGPREDKTLHPGFPPRTRKPSLKPQTSSASKRPEHPKRPPEETARLASRERSGERKRESGGRGKDSCSPFHPGATVPPSSGN